MTDRTSDSSQTFSNFLLTRIFKNVYAKLIYLQLYLNILPLTYLDMNPKISEQFEEFLLHCSTRLFKLRTIYNQLFTAKYNQKTLYTV